MEEVLTFEQAVQFLMEELGIGEEEAADLLIEGVQAGELSYIEGPSSGEKVN